MPAEAEQTKAIARVKLNDGTTESGSIKTVSMQFPVEILRDEVPNSQKVYNIATGYGTISSKPIYAVETVLTNLIYETE